MLRMTRQWDPWRELDEIRNQMNRLLYAGSNQLRLRSEFPPINLWRSEQGVAITAELPGLDPEQLDITVGRQTVTISGKPRDEQIAEDHTYRRRERLTEPFSRTVELPFEIDPQQAEANYRNGVLAVKLFRPKEQQPQKVKIKAV